MWGHLWKECSGYYLCHFRCYSTKLNWNKLRPMIHKRIQDRSSSYPIKSMVGVAYDILHFRANLIEGVSTLLKNFPVKACKFCPEVFIGETGHLIQTCYGFRRRAKNQEHEWIDGSLNDILVPVEAFHLRTMFQDLIKHEHRFDFDRIPAVVELCSQAGANIYDETLHSIEVPDRIEPLEVAIRTLEAWENLRLGVQKLLLVYPSKSCKHCAEVHIGPSGHKARLCGVFKHETWRGTHFWKKAELDDLVPPKVVWRRRPQDPRVLSDEGRNYYGHAPAVVELCFQAGAIVPNKYHKIMKLHGLPPPTDGVLVS
ncbi:hypothetical protein ACHQM5_002228 [Ranunculus cassubicifolius]